MRKLVSAPRTIVGYHGCVLSDAESILAAGQFRLSENRYDWLGKGVYFWEYAPYRALEWAKFVGLQRGEEPAVLAVTIRLGNCINLMDIRYHSDLIATHGMLRERFGEDNLPKNTARGGHYLDRLVIDTYCNTLTSIGGIPDTIRGTFPEGEPIYPGSKILSFAHTQIAVRNPDCITYLHRVKFPIGRES